MAATPSRRPTSEVRKLLLASAARVFAERGFAAAPLDEIARDAGVARSVLYRHFPSKSDLFVEAVLQPLVELLESYGAVWRSQADRPWSDQRFMAMLVGLIYDAFTTHRDVLLRVAAAIDGLDPATRDRLADSTDGLVDELIHIVQPESDRRGWVPPESLELSLRLMLGAIASVTVLGGAFLPRDAQRRPTREQAIDHISRLFLYGAQLDGPPHDGGAD